ncbi:MAG: hemerythrin domain-containing protein [Bdellovibrionaceae bacterium]|nr:hemerythrin domain-containing protein [Pseudobdellovibrionaceae bacterium]
MKKKIQSTKENQAMSPNKAFEAHRTSANGFASTNSQSFNSIDITEVILQDHRPLKALIKILKDNKTLRSEKEENLEEFAVLLLAHSKAEEQTLYVAMKDYENLKVGSFEGETEHAMAEQLVQEINASPNDYEWLAKVKVLAEIVEHHIAEEENDVLKDVQKNIPESERFLIGAEYQKLISELRMLNFRQAPRKIKYNVVHSSHSN